MSLLGLDLGTKTGWALLSREGERLDSGVWVLKGSHGERCHQLYNKILELYEFNPRLRPDLVVYEDVQRHLSGASGRVYGMLLGVVLLLCEQTHMSYVPCQVGSIKKFATGNGRASKETMIANAEAFWNLGHRDLDDNEADALWIGAYALNELEKIDATK